MTVYDVTMDKLRQLWKNFSEGIELSESDFGDYLFNLEDYENRLASGEIQW